MYSDFDLDLKDGEIAEQELKELLATTIEVKRDFRCSNTKNVAVEYESRGKLSGIAVTKAKWWAFVLDGAYYEKEVIVLIRTERLKRIARAEHKKGNWIFGGDNDTSKMVLVPLEHLVKER